MGARERWFLLAAYVAMLLAPLVLLGSLSSAEIATWFSTGMCPAGPMDRPAAPCGILELAFIVLLGGWVAFIVVPALVVWALVCTVAYAALAHWLGKRAQSAAN